MPHLDDAAPGAWRVLRRQAAGLRRARGHARHTVPDVRVARRFGRFRYGETRSYADMARRVGSPAAVRAVGTCQRSQRDRHRRSLPPRGEQERRSGRLRRRSLAQAPPAAPRSRVYALTALFRRRASRFSRAPLLGSRPGENVAEAVVAFVTCVLEEWANRLGPRHLC